MDFEGKKANLDSAEYIEFLNYINTLPDGYAEEAGITQNRVQLYLDER